MLSDVWFGVVSILLVVGVCRLGVDRITLGFFEGWISDGEKGFSTQNMVLKVSVWTSLPNRHTSYLLMSREFLVSQPVFSRTRIINQLQGLFTYQKGVGSSPLAGASCCQSKKKKKKRMEEKNHYRRSLKYKLYQGNNKASDSSRY